MKPRILFVDDNNNILMGLRRMLRGMRGDWAMDFAEGGEMALAKLDSAPADVVVTDMKMPGMSGAELLDEVAVRYPRSLRLILSGEADPEATFRTIATSHQFLQKPSNSERLIAIIKASLERRGAVPGAERQAWVTGTSRLAVSRAGRDRLTPLLRQESLPIEEIGEAFAAEPALAAKVMQLANSAYFGVGDPVSSPKAAVSLLGQDVLRALLREENLLPAFPEGFCQGYHERTVAFSRDVADLAAWIAGQQGGGAQEIALARLAGLLHALGRLLLCDQAPEDYAKVLAMVPAGATVDDAEREVFGCAQADFGAYLAQIWGLPQTVVDALRHLDRPSALEEAERAGLPLLAAHSALGIVSGLNAADPLGAAAAQLDGDFLARHGCKNKVGDWMDGWQQRETAA